MNLELKQLLEAEDFVPFDVILAGGGAYQVRNPGLCAMGDTTIMMVRAKSERKDILRLSLIGAIEILEPD